MEFLMLENGIDCLPSVFASQSGSRLS